MKKKYNSDRPNIPADIERLVKVESGHSCGVRGCNEHTYLEIHHIDENRENNEAKNLIFLCDKHHKMAHAGVIDRKCLYDYKRLLSEPKLDSETSSKDANFFVRSEALHIVDIYEVDDDNSEENFQCTLVEIKFRNAGDEVAFLKELIFTTKEHWDINTDKHHRLVEVSAHYDVKISEAVDTKCRVKVHHEIKPQETERIRFRMATDYASDPDGLSLYSLELEALYNEHSHINLSAPIIVNVSPFFESAGSFFPCYSTETINNNKAAAAEILALHKEGHKVADYILDALKSWINAPSAEEYHKMIKKN
jgi:hypothetical protein